MSAKPTRIYNQLGEGVAAMAGYRRSDEAFRRLGKLPGRQAGLQLTQRDEREFGAADPGQSALLQRLWRHVMKIGAALVLLAVGAILRFAITTSSTHGFNVPIIGDILMIVGAIGLVIWLIVWAPWASSRRYPPSPPPVDERGDIPGYRYDERYR